MNTAENCICHTILVPRKADFRELCFGSTPWFTLGDTTIVTIIKYSYLILLLSSISCSLYTKLSLHKTQLRLSVRSKTRKPLFLLKKKQDFSSETTEHWKPNCISFYFSARNFLTLCSREWNSTNSETGTPRSCTKRQSWQKPQDHICRQLQELYVILWLEIALY